MALPAPSWCDDPSLRPAPLAFKRRAPTVVVSSEPPSPPIPPAPPLPPNEDQIAHWSDECREHLSTLRAWVPRLETVLEDEEGESSDLSFSSSIDEGREIPSDVPSSFDVGDDDNDDSDRLTVVSSVDSGPSASGGANSRWEPPLVLPEVCCEPAVVAPLRRRARVATLFKRWRWVRDRVVDRLDRWRERSCAW